MPPLFCFLSCCIAWRPNVSPRKITPSSSSPSSSRGGEAFMSKSPTPPLLKLSHPCLEAHSKHFLSLCPKKFTCNTLQHEPHRSSLHEPPSVGSAGKQLSPANASRGDGRGVSFRSISNGTDLVPSCALAPNLDEFPVSIVTEAAPYWNWTQLRRGEEEEEGALLLLLLLLL